VLHLAEHRLGLVQLRAVRRREVQVDPASVLPQVDRHLVARVALRVVADHVDLSVASQSAPQVVQVCQEQRRVPPLLRPSLGEEDLAGPPVDRAPEVAPLVVPRGLDRWSAWPTCS